MLIFCESDLLLVYRKLKNNLKTYIQWIKICCAMEMPNRKESAVSESANGIVHVMSEV